MSRGGDAQNMLEITDANFEEVTKTGLTLVDFTAVWCGPCKMQAPIVERLATQYEGKVTIGKLDIDSSRETALKFGVQSIPTLLLMKDGKEVERLIGLQTEQKLQSVIDSAAGGD